MESPATVVRLDKTFSLQEIAAQDELLLFSDAAEEMRVFPLLMSTRGLAAANQLVKIRHEDTASRENLEEANFLLKKEI